METKQYIGLDVHKKTICYCVKSYQGETIEQGTVSATRPALQKWLKNRNVPWLGAMKATMFTGWIYDFLHPHADDLKVAHPEMLKAITAAKKKNDRADAATLADLLRVNLLPECTMMSTDLRELRRILRYRNMIVRTAVKMKNKMAGLLMEVGIPYNKKRLHGKRYFNNLIEQRIDDVPDSVFELLQLCRSNLELFTAIQKKLIKTLLQDEKIRQRVENLMSIPGVGEILALTWVVEMGDIKRFMSSRQAVSYCGLCCAQRESAGKEMRGPLSKKRNKHLQTILIEAAKLAPRWNPKLKDIHERALQKGNRNRATLEVAQAKPRSGQQVPQESQNFQPTPYLSTFFKVGCSFACL